MITRPVVRTVVDQHAEEAAFLWLLRDNAVLAPHYDLADLTKLDRRVEAHIDGLRIARDEGWTAVKEQLALNEPGECFAAAVLALESGDAAKIDEVITASTAEPELARGLTSALAWVAEANARDVIDSLRASDQPQCRRTAVAAAAVRRELSQDMLVDALGDSEPVVRARALYAIGELGAAIPVHMWSDGFRSDDPACHYAACWSATLFGVGESVPMLREIAEQNGPRAELACDAAARRMQLQDALAWQKELRQLKGAPRLAVIAARAIGAPALVPWLIEIMSVDELACLAGEAFNHITGVDIAYDDLERDAPDGVDAGPTEDPRDDSVALDPDEDLPWPDPELVSSWWRANTQRFPSGVRHLVGRPIDAASAHEVLRTGLQRQRIAAALELVALQPGKPLFEIRARGDRQQTLLHCSS